MSKVLIVDDNPSVRFLNARILQNLGYQVSQVDSGERAVELLQQKNPFAAIFVDYRMPGMDGLETISRIKARHPQAYLVLISAHQVQEIEHKAYKSGAIHCILGYSNRDSFKYALSMVKSR